MSQNQKPANSNWLGRFVAWLGGLFGGDQQPAEKLPPPPVEKRPPAEDGPEVDRGLSGGEISGVVGAFKPSSSGVAPEGWQLCDGRELEIDDYPALFAVIGARFGGDGTKTYSLPDLGGEIPFIVCEAGYFPLEGAGPAEWPLATEVEALIERRVRAFRDCYAQGGDPFGGHRHVSELDSEWTERQAQSMIDAYGQGHDPLQGHAHVDDLDQEWLERQAQVLKDGYSQGRDPLAGHTHVDELDPDWLERQAQVMIDAYARGDEPHFRHAHVDELDPEWLERHGQGVLDAHEQGRNPHHRHAHVDELDPAWLERQAQVIKDVYAQGEDPHFRHPTPAEAQDEIDERVAALLAAHADEEDPLATVISPSPVTAPAAGVPSAGATSAGPPGDDLTRIEGIGPKIAAALNGAGIRTYTQLASAPAAKLEALVAEGGYNLAEPATWPEQAELAAGGRWQELEALQAELKGGRRG